MNGAPTRTSGPSSSSNADIRQPRDDLGADAERFDGFVTHDQPVGARQRFQHRGFIPRLQAAKIEDFNVDAVLRCQRCRRRDD